MTICVTGGTGFLGRHLVRNLVAEGHTVRVLSRRGWGQTEAGIEDVIGSVLDAEACHRAVQGCEQVFHLAGKVSRDPDDAGELMRLHVEGTRTLFGCCKAAGVGRVIYLSTSGTIGVNTEIDRMATEEDDYPIDLVRRWPYYLSKVYAEQEALRWFKESDLPVICLNPSLILGPGDDEGSSTGDVERFLKGLVPMVPRGGMSFVDVRDVVDACKAAMTRGRPGQRYLLTGCNTPLRTFFLDVARMSGRPAPLFNAPDRLTRWTSSLLEKVGTFGSSWLPLNHIDLEIATHGWYVSSDKARAELGFAPRDPNETLRDTIDDVNDRIEKTRVSKKW